MCFQIMQSDEAEPSNEQKEMLIDDGDNDNDDTKENMGDDDSSGEDDEMDEGGANDAAPDSGRDNSCADPSQGSVKFWIANSRAASASISLQSPKALIDRPSSRKLRVWNATAGSKHLSRTSGSSLLSNTSTVSSTSTITFTMSFVCNHDGRYVVSRGLRSFQNSFPLSRRVTTLKKDIWCLFHKLLLRDSSLRRYSPGTHTLAIWICYERPGDGRGWFPVKLHHSLEEIFESINPVKAQVSACVYLCERVGNSGTDWPQRTVAPKQWTTDKINFAC